MEQKILRLLVFTVVAGITINFATASETESANADSSGKKLNQGNLVRYLDPIFDEIEIQKDIVFGESVTFAGNTEKLLLDVYSPANDEKKNRPVIVWAHGGGFKTKYDKSQGYIVAIAKQFAQRGYVCLSVNYRVRENPGEDMSGTLDDAMEDVISGLHWLRNNSNELNIDKDRIVLGGGSAGGFLIANLCYKNADDPSWNKLGIIGLVNLWGAPDLKWKTWELTKNTSPTIMVHGTEDKGAPFSNAEKLLVELKAKGVKCELVAIEGAGHTPVDHMDDFAKNISHFLYDLISSK